MLNTNQIGAKKTLGETFLKKMSRVADQASRSLSEDQTRIGQLLVDTGAIGRQALEHNLGVAWSSSQLIGTVLTSRGLVDEACIDRAVRTQAMIKSGLSPMVGRMILRYANMANMTADEAMEAFSIESEEQALDSWLYELLSNCENYWQDLLNESKAAAKKSNVSWSRYCVRNGVITLNILAAAMHTLALVDLGRMSFDDAVALVRAVSTRSGAWPVLLRCHIQQQANDLEWINLPATLYVRESLSERTALDLICLSHKNNTDARTLIAKHDLLSMTA